MVFVMPHSSQIQISRPEHSQSFYDQTTNHTIRIYSKFDIYIYRIPSPHIELGLVYALCGLFLGCPCVSCVVHHILGTRTAVHINWRQTRSRVGVADIVLLAQFTRPINHYPNRPTAFPAIEECVRVCV